MLADVSDVSGSNRILIFGKESNMAWVGSVKHLLMDGTFSIAPPLFAQVFVILAEREGHVFPLLYALLQNKKSQTYERLFYELTTNWPELQV